MKRRRQLVETACGRIVYAGAVAGCLALLSPALAETAAGTTNTLNDRTIADTVEDEFLYDPAVWPEKIDIAANDGVVTLSGVTDNILEKDRAARIAGTVKGVRAVINDIRVRPTSLKTAEGLEKGVREGLATDPATDAFEMSVAAEDTGKVTLTGTVDSWQEKKLAGIVTKGAVGVTGIDNRITVAMHDASARPADEVRAEVEQRLFWDVLVDASLIDVTVEDRTVTLSGTVGSASERYRARHLAHVNGVAKVDANGLETQDWAQQTEHRNPRFVDKSDERVAEAIHDVFLYDPRVKPFSIQVDVSGSVATLRGTVDNMATKRSAERDARNTAGVSRVVNRLKVRPRTAVSDTVLTARLQEALLRDPYIEDYELSAVVDDGIAKLYGTVDSYFEKSQADSVAQRVNGVIRVVNNLDVRKDHEPLVYDPYLSYYPPHLYDWYNYDPVPTYRSDRAIREAVEDELWWSPFVDANDVRVTVVNGRATLSGQVDSWSEWQSASENAWEGGANWVVNNLDIDTPGQG